MFRRLPKLDCPMVAVTVDGQAIEAIEGEMVAGLLARIDPFFARTNPVNGDRRAPYCMMGVCFECLVKIDGKGSVQSCFVQVREGMRIERQHGPLEMQS